MQVSIVIKECKRCGAQAYGGTKDMQLTIGQLVEIIYQKIVQCPNCPKDIGPRDPGYRRMT